MNELITVMIDEETKEQLVNARDLQDILEKVIFKKTRDKARKTLSKIINEFNSTKDLTEKSYKMLKLGINMYDRFDLIIFDVFLEWAYSNDLIEDLFDNRRIPSGNDYSYGRYFEKYIIDCIKEDINIVSTQYKQTDAIIEYNGKKYILEIKCGQTDTKEQVQRYMKNTGIENFVTINGHMNNVRFNEIDVVRITKSILNDECKINLY